MRVLSRMMWAAIFLVVTTAAESPASAEEYRHTDATRDMYRSDVGEPYVADPSHANADLTTLRVRHRTHRVFIRAQFRVLHPSFNPRGSVDLYGSMRTNRPRGQEPRWFQYSVSYYPNRPHRPHMEVEDDQGQTCHAVGNHNTDGYLPSQQDDALDSSINYTSRTLRFSIARSCLGWPRWVRASANSLSGARTTWLDEWHNPFTDPDFPVLEDYSPRLARD